MTGLMRVNWKIYPMLWLLSCILHGCKTGGASDSGFHFTLLDAAQTHIRFSNTITESDSVNIFIDDYLYNGSGVAVGDFNNDGLPDLFFCGSMVSSRLYINKGGFVFEDVTEKAGLQTDRWCTGASVVDINGDGFRDLYICASHAANGEKRKNLLFINDGQLHFTEQAATYGLADTGFATQAAFFDYDRDGDLDMYLLNHRLYDHTANNLKPKDTSGLSPAADRLYRNEGIPAGSSHPVFQDVSMEAGIKEGGYGLGLVITDVNGDGWADIYVANDYIANDLLWLNSQDGHFSNVIATSIRHQSYNSMGVDAADINNDLLPDIATVDMLPENNGRKKMMLNTTGQEKYDLQWRYGYQPAFMRNMLQLNNGNRKGTLREEPFFSEIGQLAGIAETDWSWSVLMADFDNDGWKDIYITNGLGKDVTNNDYAFFRTAAYPNNYTFGVSNAEQLPVSSSLKDLRRELDAYGSMKMDNYFYRNSGGLRFDNITHAAGLAGASLSNGAAYADLDNDGDLDLVVNNINQEAFVYRNELRQTADDSASGFLRVELKGPSGNPSGLGTKITLFNGTSRQCLEQLPVRGFESAVDERLHFGMGNSKLIDSLQVQWPDGKQQLIRNIKANQAILIKYSDATTIPPVQAVNTLFTDITDGAGISFQHAEASNYDFGIRRPLLQKYSQLGPCLAAADVNGDGLTDFFAGGAANQPGKIFIQQRDGCFAGKDLVSGIKPGEDLCAVFFDADGDGNTDLLIAGGSLEFGVTAYNQPRLYNNDGKGNFSWNAAALPVITDITRAIAVADYDGDGDDDVFLGGRLLPQQYPHSPRSYLLRNDKGNFLDATAQVCPALASAGMIDAVLFTDFNNDHLPDLVVCGEWTEIRFFRNERARFTEVTGEAGLAKMHGWWRSLAQADVDGDGDPDYIAGNMGLNNRYHPELEQPVLLYVKDMDGNGSEDMVPAYPILNKQGKYELFPALDRSQLADQAPSVKKKYLLHRDYSAVNMQQLQNDFGTDGWTVLSCETFSSVWIENLGQGKFKAHPLPLAAQLSPINCIVTSDLDGDGHTDLVLAGNEYQAAALIGRYDASYGLVLKGDGKGGFVPCSFAESGLILDGDIKAMQLISGRSKENLLLAAANDSPLRAYRLNPLVNSKTNRK